ncbi:MAG TPA: hypothetical protein VGI40_03940 [Pirellulaceae bacterium]|jgi:hypothetical protein
MTSICHSLVRAVAVLLFAASAIALEPTGSVANVPTSMSAGTPGLNSQMASGASKASERLREGTKLVDVVGTFQSAGGDSISFSRDGGKESFRVLENLALQRVGQALDLNAKHWVVSGVITEYRGANYLLLTKAVVQLQDSDGATQ